MRADRLKETGKRRCVGSSKDYCHREMMVTRMRQGWEDGQFLEKIKIRKTKHDRKM